MKNAGLIHAHGLKSEYGGVINAVRRTVANHVRVVHTARMNDGKRVPLTHAMRMKGGKHEPLADAARLTVETCMWSMLWKIQV